MSLLIIYWRAPRLIYEPRFYAEEGTLFFSYAFANPFFLALFSPSLTLSIGYYNFYANLSTTLAANLVPLEYAPFITMLFALFVQFIPIMIILKGKSVLWDSTEKKIFSILIYLFAPSSGEIWLQTINSQFYFCLITFMILLENQSRTDEFKSWWYRILLLVSGLTGITSIFLTPFFIYTAWKKKSREINKQTLILIGCAFVHLTIFLLSMKSQPTLMKANRLSSIDLPTLMGILWIQTLVLPFLGSSFGSIPANFLKKILDQRSLTSSALGIILLILLILLFYYLTKKSAIKAIIGGSFLFITPLLIIFSLGEKSQLLQIGAGSRYFFTPIVILIFLLLSNVELNKKQYKESRSLLSISLLLIAIVLGLASYRETVNVKPNMPEWKEEVKKWRKDHEYFLKIWPDGWKTPLKREIPGDFPIPADYDGDGKTDIAVFVQFENSWIIRDLGTYRWGEQGDVPVPGDYNGDGRADTAVWRPSDGYWFIRDIGNFQWGAQGDVPVPGDYNGDGRTDTAVWRPSDGYWFIKDIGNFQWGAQGDVPVPGDYNGDGRTDIAVWRPSDRYWFIRDIGKFQWGTKGDILIPDDYDGDGKTDLAVYSPSSGNWSIKDLGNFQWGTKGDIPVPADYDGDGRTDLAVWKPSNGNWAIKDIGNYQWGQGNKRLLW